MEKYEKVILIVFIVYFIFSMCEDYKENFGDKIKMVSQTDGNVYPVVGAFEDGQEAANLLGEINLFIEDFLKHLKRKYIKSKYGTKKQKRMVEVLLKNYTPKNVSENNPTGKVNTSFVLNKGEKISFCLREKQTGENKLHTMETLKFVVLHEIAHITTIGIGHGNDFWKNFKFLLREAQIAGMYHPIDYGKYPIVYCSVDVTYNPLFDSDLDINF